MQATQKKAAGFEQRIARGPDGTSIQINETAMWHYCRDDIPNP